MRQPKILILRTRLAATARSEEAANAYRANGCAAACFACGPSAQAAPNGRGARR